MHSWKHMNFQDISLFNSMKVDRTCKYCFITKLSHFHRIELEQSKDKDIFLYLLQTFIVHMWLSHGQSCHISYFYTCSIIFFRSPWLSCCCPTAYSFQTSISINHTILFNLKHALDYILFQFICMLPVLNTCKWNPVN